MNVVTLLKTLDEILQTADPDCQEEILRRFSKSWRDTQINHTIQLMRKALEASETSEWDEVMRVLYLRAFPEKPAQPPAQQPARLPVPQTSKIQATTGRTRTWHAG